MGSSDMIRFDKLRTVVLLALLVTGGTCSPAFASLEGPVSPDATLIRLGTAASPFGWAKALGDFDNDGQPDVAVADRISRSDGQTEYELEIDLSGGGAQDFRFTSVQEALDVELADVDADGDLDIVLRPVLSRVASAIWVNDGGGRFHERKVDPRTAPELPWDRLKHGSRSPLDSVLAPAVSPRITGQRWLMPAMLAPPVDTGVSAASFSGEYHETADGSSQPSRAPPIAPLTL
jgi:hypothetical protein